MKKTRLFFSIALLVTASCSTTAFADIISYYNFNDGSGNVLHDLVRGASGDATIYGSSYTWSNGVAGGGLYFYGAGAGAVAPMVSGITGGFSLSAWVKYDSFSDWATVAKNWSTGDSGAFHLGLDDTNNYFSSYVQADTVSLVDGSTIELNQWYNVLFTYDGTQQSLYLNGVLQGTSPMTGALYTGFPYIGFGAKVGPDGAPANSFLNGTLDEISIYNTALSAAEVSTLYVNGTQGIGAVPEPSTYALFGLGAIGMLMVMRRKKTA